MVLNKKRIFLYSSILLLFLVGAYFVNVVNGVGFVNRIPTLSTGFFTTNTTTFTPQNNSAGFTGGYSFGFTELLNWSKGGNIKLFNFTITLNSDAINISEINITLPSAGFTNITIYAVGGRNTSNQFGDVGGNWTLARVYNDVADSTYIATFRAVNTSSGLFPNSNLTSGVNISMWFNAIATNHTEAVYNWTITLRNVSTADNGFGALFGVDGLAPRLNTTNVTDGTNTKTSFDSTTKYLLYDNSNPQQGINITIEIKDYNADRVLLIYNGTGGSLNLQLLRNLLGNVTFMSNFSEGSVPAFPNSNFTVLSSGSGGGQVGNATGLLALNRRSDVNLASAPSFVYTFNISNNTWGLGASDGTTFKYVFVVYDLYNNTEIINNSNAEYILARDVNVPSVTLKEPSDTTIGLYNPIKYTCDGSDTSGLESCTLTSTKPDGTVITKTGCGTEHTLTTTDNNNAGTYTIKCEVKDNVGRKTSKSSSFSVSAAGGGDGSGSSGGGGGSSGGSGSSSNPVTVEKGASADAGALSTTETFTSIAKEGTVKFNVVGSSHSVKVLDITETSVTIEVASTPKQLTLNIGETKEVDVNDDTKNDMSVTLKSITDGKADLVFKIIEAVAPGEETGEQPKEEGIVTGEETESSSTTWLWILIVIVAILVIWYFTKKKQ